jgi:hypothetical protein
MTICENPGGCRWESFSPQRALSIAENLLRGLCGLRVLSGEGFGG